MRIRQKALNWTMLTGIFVCRMFPERIWQRCLFCLMICQDWCNFGIVKNLKIKKRLVIDSFLTLLGTAQSVYVSRLGGILRLIYHCRRWISERVATRMRINTSKQYGSRVLKSGLFMRQTCTLWNKQLLQCFKPLIGTVIVWFIYRCTNTCYNRSEVMLQIIKAWGIVSPSWLRPRIFPVAIRLDFARKYGRGSRRSWRVISERWGVHMLLTL